MPFFCVTSDLFCILKNLYKSGWKDVVQKEGKSAVGHTESFDK